MSKFILVIATFTFGVFLQCMAFCEQESSTRKILDTTIVDHPINRTDIPVLSYRCSMSHHGIEILKPSSNIARICVWKDGMIAWRVGRSSKTWYQTIIPAEKVESVVREITEEFANYPAKNRPRWTSIIFSMGANASPRIKVYSSQHYESFGMDKSLLEFYMKNRKIFQSGDEEAILETITAVRGGLPPGINSPNGQYIGPHPAYMFNFKGLVGYYRATYPQAGLAKQGTSVYSNEELLKCAALYTADVEHLLFAEKKILSLLPSTQGLKSKRIDESRYGYIIEYETQGDKTEFFYRPE